MEEGSPCACGSPRARGRSIEVPGLGTTRGVGNLVSLSETPASAKPVPPLLGEANTEILQPLGFGQSELDELEQHATSVREQAFALLAVMNQE